MRSYSEVQSGHEFGGILFNSVYHSTRKDTGATSSGPVSSQVLEEVECSAEDAEVCPLPTEEAQSAVCRRVSWSDGILCF